MERFSSWYSSIIRASLLFSSWMLSIRLVWFFSDSLVERYSLAIESIWKVASASWSRTSTNLFWYTTPSLST